MAGEYTLGVFQPALEALDPDALARLQVDGMQRTLARVGGNPAWSRRLGGVHPEDVKRVEDWARLPFLTKDELRDAYPFTLACGGAAGYRRVHMSSGHHRQPDPQSVHGRRRRAVGRGDGALLRGGRRHPRDVIQITPSFGLFTGGFGFHYGAERLGAMVVPTGAGRTRSSSRSCATSAPPCCRPSRPTRCGSSRSRARRGSTCGSLRLRVAILGSEMWSDELRARIERELGVTAFDIIGMTETGGPGLGIDCAARDGIHVWEDHYYVEIVDPPPAPAAPDGDEGELVVSTLTRQGLPLVRYRTHDLTRIVAARALRVRPHAAAPGPPARPHRRHGHLQGRELLSAPGRDRCCCASPASATSTRSRSTPTSACAWSSRRSPGAIPRWPGGCGASCTTCWRSVPEIRLCPVGTLERPPGKAVRVVDRRTHR